MRGARCAGGSPLAAALLLGAVACGQRVPEAPGLAPGEEGLRYEGPGDQHRPAIGHGILAFVDYAKDESGGCFNTPDDLLCEGTLRIVDLARRTEILRTSVRDPKIAVGDGFVIWVDRRSASGYDGGAVRLLWIEDGKLERLDGDRGEVEAGVTPAAFGRTVAWARRRPWGSIEILDLETRERRLLDRRWGLYDPSFALAGGRLAWSGYDPERWELRPRVQGIDEAEARSVEVGLEARLEGPVALGPRWLAFREVRRTCEAPPCELRLVLLGLEEGSRRPVARPGLSRLGPLALDGERVFFLVAEQGPYELFAAPLGGGPPTRLSPEGVALSVSEPIAAGGGWVAYAYLGDQDFDLRVARLAPLE